MTNIISDVKKCGSISIKKITLYNLPRFIGWISVFIWIYLVWMPGYGIEPRQMMLGIQANKLFVIIYLVSAVLVICFFDGRAYTKLAPASAFILLIALIATLFFKLEIIYLYILIPCAVATGHLFACFGFSYFMILNNSEKFYAIFFGVIMSKMVYYIISCIGNTIVFKLCAGLVLVILIICAFFIAWRSIETVGDINVIIPLSAYSSMLLVFAVYFLNDITVPFIFKNLELSTGKSLAAYYLAGIILGALITYVLRRFAGLSMCYGVNISFFLISLGSVMAIIYKNALSFAYVSSFLFGAAYASGMITIYYISGIMSKKFSSVIFYRIGAAISGAGYMSGFILLLLLKNSYESSSFLHIALISIIITMILVFISPMFSSKLYNAECMDDLNRPDVTHGTRLDEKLAEFKLSPKEKEVCRLMLGGYTLRQISATMGIAYSTANTYGTSLYRKLNINSKTELLLMFRELI
ncbi:MAG: helix-turn-helix transcriptional regulator [Oscillospiraceae bacterium]|nr:helix-turn-helix transcriptional regulator [Oscillospiraceae bacterium]